MAHGRGESWDFQDVRKMSSCRHSENYQAKGEGRKDEVAYRRLWEQQKVGKMGGSQGHEGRKHYLNYRIVVLSEE